jgi:hypothetical protein
MNTNDPIGVSTLTPNDLNFVLFSSAGEEQERCGHGMYGIPNHGDLVYGGLYGVLKAVNDAGRDNNL